MKKNVTPKGSDHSLEEMLFIFRRKLSDIVKRKVEDIKCPISQIETLSFIAEKGDPSMKEIADYLKITPPSATVIIEIMQKKKLITRIVSKKDRRTIKVALTPKAWKFFKLFHQMKLDIFTDMLSKLKNDEKMQLIKILGILIKE